MSRMMSSLGLGLGLFLFSLTVVRCQFGFEVYVYNSLGVRISDSNPNPKNLYAGDFIYCHSPNADDGTFIYYAWVKIDPAAVGPNFMSFPNEDDHTNRLFIGKTLGMGEPTTYTCIATDVDPYEVRDQFTGAQVTFRVVDPPDAGFIFDERDYVGFSDQPLDLACVRHSPYAQIVWETLNVDDEPLLLLYNSDNPGPLPDGYEWVNDNDDDDRTLRITLSLDTAVLTRCTITYNTMTDISRTAMLFVIEFESEGCEVNNFDPAGNIAGTDLRFHGCDVTTMFSGQVGLTKNDYTTMTYWQQSTVAEPDVYTPIDESRSLDADSVYDMQASRHTHDFMYSCAVEVHREKSAVIRAKIENICADDYTINVIENSVRFRIYYTELREMEYEDFLKFDARNNAVVNPTDKDLFCFIDRMPTPGPTATVRLHFKVPGTDEWVEDNDQIIRKGDISVGYQYKCVFNDSSDDDYYRESGIVHMVAGFVLTSIYSSSGEILNDTSQIYSIDTGDYIECRSHDPINMAYPPSFFWYRSNQLPNEKGPKTIHISNTNDQHNRLPISAGLGQGEPISYRCIGADFLASYIIPDFAGTLVKFETGMPSGGRAGTTFLQEDYAAVSGDTVELECRRNIGTSSVVWETVDSEGAVVNLIYDSNDGSAPLPEGYVLTGSGNNFDLQIDVNEQNAMLTRCTVSGVGLLDATATAMIYVVERVDPDGCRSNVAGDSDVGDMVELRGCEANIIINAASGIQPENYDSVFYWEQKLSDTESYTMLDESRVVEKASVHHLEALSELHNSAYRCAVQISRPNEFSASAYVYSVCENDVPLTVLQNDVRFRIYYGQEANAGGDNYLHLSSSAVDVGKTEEGALTCQIDRHPAPAQDDSYFMQSREGNNGQWVDHNDVISSDDVLIGHHYRCLYRDDDGEDAASSVIRIVDGINDLTEVAIYLNGELLDEDTEYDVAVGDNFMCQPTDNTALVTTYVWVKSTAYNAVGPNIIQTANNEDGSNSLYVYPGLGEGEFVAYRCIAGADFGAGFTELLGTNVRFSVIGAGSAGGSTSLAGSVICVLIAFTAYLFN